MCHMRELLEAGCQRVGGRAEDIYHILDLEVWNQTVKKLAELKKLKEVERQRDQEREMKKVHRKTPEEMKDHSPHMDPA